MSAQPVSPVADDRPDAAALFASFVFAALLIDSDGIVVEANPACEDLLGRSASRIVGARFSELAVIGDPRVAEGLSAPDAPLIARDIPLASGPTPRRINLTSSPIVSQPGWRVITLSETGRELGEGSEEMAVRAPSVLAHEIKNPLAAIRGASQLLARRVEARDRPLAAIIASEVDRIASLVDRMQQLGSRAGTMRAECNLHEAIRAALATIRAARQDDVVLVEAFDPSLPMVSADPGALEQVLINLVGNACDAASASPQPRVEVRTRFVSGLSFNVIRLGKATRLPIEIAVIDNGPGIDPALHDHVFEPFVSGKAHGQGLGLALVRKLVRDMGGRIAHDRDDRAGLTVFRINLAVAGKGG